MATIRHAFVTSSLFAIPLIDSLADLPAILRIVGLKDLFHVL